MPTSELLILAGNQSRQSISVMQRRADFSEAAAKATVGNNASKRLLETLSSQVQELLTHIADWQKQHEGIAARCYVASQPPGRIVVAALSNKDAFDFELANQLQKLSDDLSNRFTSFEIETIQVPASSLQEFLRER